MPSRDPGGPPEPPLPARPPMYLFTRVHAGGRAWEGGSGAHLRGNHAARREDERSQVLVQMWRSWNTAGGDVRQSGWKRLAVPQEVSTQPSCGPAVPLPGVYPGELKTHVHTKTWTGKVLVTCFVRAKKWKEPTCPSFDERVKNTEYCMNKYMHACTHLYVCV